jgi:hypothetical protein
MSGIRVIGRPVGSLVFTPPPPPEGDFSFAGDNFSGTFLGSVYLAGPRTGPTEVAQLRDAQFWESGQPIVAWDFDHDRGAPAGNAFGGWRIAWDGTFTYEVTGGSDPRSGTLEHHREDSAEVDSSYRLLVDLTGVDLQAGETLKLTATAGTYAMLATWLIV